MDSLFGEPGREILLFYLRKSLGRDPFEVLWEDPRVFYHGLEKFFGVSARIFIEVLINKVNEECGLNASPERFVRLMKEGGERSIEEIREYVKKVAELEGAK